MQFFWRIYEDDKQAVLREYKQDASIYKDLQAEKQQQLECVFYQLEETADRTVKDNHEIYLDRVEDLKSGVSNGPGFLVKYHISMFLPIVALRLCIL